MPFQVTTRKLERLPKAAISIRPLDAVRINPDRIKEHDDDAIAAFVEDFEEHGQRVPIVVGTDDVAACGNGPLDAARVMGWAFVVVIEIEQPGKSLTLDFADLESASEYDFEPQLYTENPE